jgi:hypothetical protein
MRLIVNRDWTFEVVNGPLIGSNAHCVVNPNFENAIVKIQLKKENELTMEEKEAVKVLLRNDDDNNESQNENESFFVLGAKYSKNFQILVSVNTSIQIGFRQLLIYANVCSVVTFKEFNYWSEYILIFFPLFNIVRE